ncbi:hypothetical protein BDA96_05G139800 [Sorghum bicolor]|uniref:Uncharacterized protein n=2 Tax=Sorghum bicolor TaxID=4558 RepID=A0A921UGJ7_SORBI|nr:hypothetical protein BDA96_05G139800 [Sorghum bicolor]KXG28484.1 hypothetical protein SORBI_3005G127900 [Sorghum bicolor]
MWWHTSRARSRPPPRAARGLGGGAAGVPHGRIGKLRRWLLLARRGAREPCRWPQRAAAPRRGLLPTVLAPSPHRFGTPLFLFTSFWSISLFQRSWRIPPLRCGRRSAVVSSRSPTTPVLYPADATRSASPTTPGALLRPLSWSSCCLYR